MMRSIRLPALALLLVMAGCGGQPIAFPTPESELGTRPGLLTGETGVWEIHPGQSTPSPPADKSPGTPR